MTDASSTSSHLSVVMTTTEVTQIIMTSSSSRDSKFYFQCAVVVVGILGTAANALILYALVASKQHKKHTLIFNQNVLDLCSSVFTIIAYSLKVCNIYLTGPIGYWLCIMLLSDSLIWCGIIGSVINLAAITIERYLKVVHPVVWSKKKLRKRMTYSAVAFSWIASIIYNVALVLPTTAVLDGACYAYAIWMNKADRVIHLACDFACFYVVVILLFIFCYWRILLVVRRQARVMAGHSAVGSSTSTGQSQSNKIQSNVTKTMILVSVLYAFSRLSIYVCSFLISLNPNPILPDSSFYASMFVAFLYTCSNPFIYATKFDPVKKVLLDKLSCKKISQQATENVANRPV